MQRAIRVILGDADPFLIALRGRACGTQSTIKENTCWVIRDFYLTLPVIQCHAQRRREI